MVRFVDLVRHAAHTEETCYSTRGTITISYSHVHRTPPVEPLDMFHSRQISYPVNVTVYHTLECNNLDIIPYKGLSGKLSPNSPESQEDQNRRALLDINDADADNYCLVSMDVSNMYGLPFEVTLERHQAGRYSWCSRPLVNLTILFIDTPFASMTRVIPPGSTSRYFSPIFSTQS